MKLNFVVIFFILLLASSISSQSIPLSQLDKKSKKTYAKALKCLSKGHRAEGIMKLETVTSKYPNFKKGTEKLVGIYLDEGQNEKAIDLMNRMLASTADQNPKVYTSLSYAYEDTKDWDAAINTIDKLLAQDNLKPKMRETVIHRRAELVFRKNAYAHPVEFTPVSLANSINTNNTEFHPGLTADGRTMIYVKVGKGKFRNEDLYHSRLMENDSFSLGIPIESLNTEGQEGAFSLSQDGSVLVFTACDYQNSIGGCDLYISFKKDEVWSPAKNMGPTINSRYWDSSPTITADNRTIYFSSKRPGGHGGTDIWMVQLQENNSWATPVNLGPEINTAKNDEAPFIHPDGSSLYFISEGHVGMGSYDIFMSRLDEDSWSSPANLGYPINTVEREGGLFVELSGNKAYYSTQLDFAGDTANKSSGDIYYFELPEKYKPNAVSYVRLEVRDATTEELIDGVVELRGLDGAHLSPDMDFALKDGTLLTTIIAGEYSLSINKEGYLFHSENIILVESRTQADPFIYKVELQPIVEVVTKESKPIILNNIFFASGSSTLLPKSDNEINKLLELLNSNESLSIKILGHTDNVGSDQKNLILSSDRAKAVYNRLISAGISSTRVKYEGRGETEPIADNDTKDGRQRNRRTEFILI